MVALADGREIMIDAILDETKEHQYSNLLHLRLQIVVEWEKPHDRVLRK
jgi:hypothetical protein